MLKIKIPFSVNGQTLKATSSEYKLREGNKNYFYATFTCSDEWEGLDSLKAIFKRNNLVIRRDLVETDDGYECQIPNEVMAKKGVFTVGIGGGDTFLTNEVYVWVNHGCSYSGDGNYEPDIPDVPDIPDIPDDPIETISLLGDATVGLLVLDCGG